MNLTRKIAIVIIALIILVLPSVRMLTHIYYIFSSFVMALIFCVCVLFMPIPIVSRVTAVLVTLAIFRYNITMTGSLVNSVVKFGFVTPLSTRIDDSELRTSVQQIFTEHFMLKTNFDQFPERPSIIVANYCKDRMENMACVLLPGKIAIMMRRGLTILGLHKLVKWPLFTEESGNYEKTKNLVMGHALQGHHVFGYITTKTLMRPDLFVKIRSGMFSIAKDLGIPVTPVAFDYIDMGPLGQIPPQNYEIRVGKTEHVTNVQLSMRKTMHFFRDTMTEFIKNKYTNIS